jgi:hypothetical protein
MISPSEIPIFSEFFFSSQIYLYSALLHGFMSTGSAAILPLNATFDGKVYFSLMPHEVSRLATIQWENTAEVTRWASCRAIAHPSGYHGMIMTLNLQENLIPVWWG